MNFDNIENAGIDYVEGVERFSGISALYEKYAVKFLKDETFQRLEKAMAAKEYKNAFEEAHTLKGEAGNLSFITLYNNLCNLVEALRNLREPCKVEGLFKEVSNSYDIVVKIINEEFQHGDVK